MRKFLFVFAIAGIICPAFFDGLAAPTALAAGMPTVYSASFLNDEVPKISLADAKKEYDAGTAIIVDVRDEGSFKQEHVKGALHITTATLAAEIDKLPKDKTIIAYCSCPNEHSSSVWVTAAQKKGLKNVFAMIGGTRAWKEAGYPMEGTAVNKN